MTTLENTPIKKFIELYNFMFPDPDGDGSYLLDAAEEIGEDFIRGLLIKPTKDVSLRQLKEFFQKNCEILSKKFF